jgi:tRNA (guanine-N7-)-methyltransferase
MPSPRPTPIVVKKVVPKCPLGPHICTPSTVLFSRILPDPTEDKALSFKNALLADTLNVLRRLPDGALSFVYLLHPDPWPKMRHIKRRMMNDGPIDLIAQKLRPGGEFRFGTDHPVYLRHALMVMQRHCDQFEWLCDRPADFLNRPGGWPETRYEVKARRQGHEVWYFRYRKV